MIYKNNCLFLFKKDLPSELKDKLDVTEMELKYFFPPYSKSVDVLKDYAEKANLIAYIDSKKNIVKYLNGPMQGHMESF